MRKQIVAVLIVLALSTVAFAGDWAIYGVSVPAPEENDTFDNGAGVEAQYRMPVGEDFDIGFLCGLKRWEADKISTSNRCFSQKISGDVTDLTLGVSGILKIVNEGRLTINAEAGIAHHILSSDVDVDTYVGRRRSARSSTVELEYDNLTTLFAGLNLEYEVQKATAILFGVGYQFDMAQEDVKLLGAKTPLRNGLEGVMFKAGIVLRH